MKQARTRSLRSLLVAFPAIAMLALMLAAACGDDGESPPTVSVGPSAVSHSGPGTITVTSSAIEGQKGRVLLVFAAPEAGGAQVARACIPITSDSFEAPATVLTDIPDDNNPCGSATPETILPESAFTLTAGVYAPPAQTPEVETTQTIRVNGDMTTEIDGASLSR